MRETGNAAAKSADAPACGARPYHHGDLSRALVAAGRRILEAEGPTALSLRAVAREAGVSPAAPYHHFKDKSELLDAVAEEGWRELGDAIAKGRAAATDPRLALNEIGVAYVAFARQNPALYRLMYHAACNRSMMPDKAKGEDSGYGQVREALIAAGADPTDERELQLTQIAAWCNAHGVAEMVGFKEFETLKEAMGGEEAFVRGILRHTGIFSRRPRAVPD
ncbi:MAG: transcriptional regulator, TetR family [Caulobacteraceae bacterium]|nr:transcriptional regulator, TetR family [Caulobacteraceae bacterium]